MAPVSIGDTPLLGTQRAAGLRVRAQNIAVHDAMVAGVYSDSGQEPVSQVAQDLTPVWLECEWAEPIRSPWPGSQGPGSYQEPPMLPRPAKV